MTYTTDPDVLMARLSKALRKERILVPESYRGASVTFCMEQMALQRSRLADIVESLGDLYDSLDQEQIVTLARLIRRHYVDTDGNLSPQDD